MGNNKPDNREISQEGVNVLLAMKGFDNAESIASLWDQFTTYAEGVGADLMSYHHFTAEYAPGHKNEAVHTKGFPDAWVDTYMSNNYVDFDPIIQRSKITCRPFRWNSVLFQTTLTEQQKDYMSKLQAWMKGDGYGVPVFGPSGRNGYFGIGSMKGLKDWSPLAAGHLHMACESLHLRYCELRLLEMEHDFTLTPRELSILENMAMGRSDALICGLIGVQLNSIESGISRILKKMRVNDRPSAILRGVGCGLLNPVIIDAKL